MHRYETQRRRTSPPIIWVKIPSCTSITPVTNLFLRRQSAWSTKLFGYERESTQKSIHICMLLVAKKHKHSRLKPSLIHGRELHTCDLKSPRTSTHNLHQSCLLSEVCAIVVVGCFVYGNERYFLRHRHQHQAKGFIQSVRP